MKPFMAIKDLSDQFGLCKATVRARVDEIRGQLGKRYSRKSIISDGKILLISTAVFADWLSVRKTLKYADPFDIREWNAYLGM